MHRGILGVTMQNRWNNRISDGCVCAQIRKGLGMHLVTYMNHDTVPGGGGDSDIFTHM